MRMNSVLILGFLASCSGELPTTNFYPEHVGELVEALVLSPQHVWSYKHLTVCYTTALPWETISTIERAAHLWTENTGVKFHFRSLCADAPHADISIGQHDFSTSSVAAWSYVGTTSKNHVPSMSFNLQALGSRLAAAVVHEFGHALGFEHENVRSDRPDHCVQTPIQSDVVHLGRYDHKSIMNCCDPRYLERGPRLSRGDRQGAAIVYPP